jgi:acetyl esterase/lipase
MLYAISDWNNAYANMPNIPGGEAYPERWAARAEAFRHELLAANRARLDVPHGDHPRDRHDLLLPEGAPRGLIVFIHGGYWMRFDRSLWSHLAAGPLAHGFAVAMPSYPLCPEVRISAIAEHVARAVEQTSKEVDGPIVLAGHSAGGHLASRMMTTGSPLAAAAQARVRRVVSISGVHDLRPLLATAINDTLHLDAAEAAAESPALLVPVAGTTLIAWVGANERSEFVRQNALIASTWLGLGARTEAVAEPDRHHFDVIDGLEDAGHPLTWSLVAGD